MTVQTSGGAGTASRVDMVCAFDIWPDGRADPIDAAWPSPAKQDGAAYRWLHFDVSAQGFAGWARHHLPALAAATLLQSETRPRCDVLEGGLILNLRGVNLNAGANAEDMVSLRLWISAGLIVSARLRKVWAIDAIRQEAEAGTAPQTLEHFLTAVTHGLTKRLEKASLHLVEETDALEERAIDAGPALSGELAGLRQSVIKLRRFVRPQSEALADLAGGTVWPFDKQHVALLEDTKNRVLRTLEELDAMADRLSAIQDHVEVVQAAALGRNGYLLSVAAAIFLPLGFLTGLLGINVGGIPGTESPYAFALVALASVLIGVLLFLVFRILKWL
ncbi:MAG: CorA family divalent cation transporter [Pseudomonadota bacterium]